MRHTWHPGVRPRATPQKHDKPLEPLEEEPQTSIQTQQSLNPSSIPNTESDYDPSLTELNAILDENPRMEFCPQQQHTVS